MTIRVKRNNEYRRKRGFENLNSVPSNAKEMLMLVLSRKKNQTILIDGGIEVQILQTRGGIVKVGISAPDDVRIVRGELEIFPEIEPSGSADSDQEMESRSSSFHIAK